jgi:hypothetical protein
MGASVCRVSGWCAELSANRVDAPSHRNGYATAHSRDDGDLRNRQGMRVFTAWNAEGAVGTEGTRDDVATRSGGTEL